MAFFKGLWAQQPEADKLPAFGDDLVYPVHALDDTKTFRSILITWTLCFNDVLDHEKLQSSLSTLLNTGDWKKLGGRLRLKEDGKLEIHVPRQFTTQRPAFVYSREEFKGCIEDHAVARELPKFNGTASISPGPQAFNHFAARSDAPRTMEDLLVGDVPQISFHVTSFANATLIALCWPHTLMDVMGQHAFIHAWSLVLAGREAEVPPVLGAQEDALSALVESSSEQGEEYALKSKQLKGLTMLKFGARFAWDMLTGPTPETRTVCLPKDAVASLRQQAGQDLAEGSDGGEVPFVSDGDVLTAWAIRAVATGAASSRPITALHAMNARFRLPSLLNAQGVYLQNMLVPGYTYVSPEVAEGSMGSLALHNRTSLTKQATEAQVLASLREQRVAGDPSTVLYTDSDAILLPFTDWTKAKFFSTADFGSAVLRAGDSTGMRINPSGTPTFFHASSRQPLRTSNLMVVVLGKDHGGNYWIVLTLPPLAWAHVETSLEALKNQKE